MKKFDVTALGEILIDFTYAGLSERGECLFEQNPGGAPANVLAAAGRLGSKAAFIGKVGKDMHGDFLKKTIETYGIDSTSLIATEEAFTTLAFVSLDENGERSFSFARKPGADTQLKPAEISEKMIQESKVFHFGSLSLTEEPSKSATLKALEYAKKHDVVVSYDPNYRALLWENEEAARNGMRLPLESVDIIKISDEEMMLLTDCDVAEEAAHILHEKGIACVIITMGKNGALLSANGNLVYADSFETEVIDTTGAGDCFMGSFLHCVTASGKDIRSLNEEDLKQFVSFSNAAAAICVSRRGAIHAMPTKNEVLAFIKSKNK